MLSSDQLHTYFNKNLEWPNWKEDLDKERVQFLNKMVHTCRFQNYFHNMKMAATDPKDRRVPTRDDVIKTMLEDGMGVCIHQNLFVAIVLQSIGFDAIMIAGTFIDSDHVNNHCMCVVKLPEDLTFLLDIGSVLPIHDAIPVHALPYTNVAAGMRYEYRFSEETNLYERWQFDGGFFKGKHADPSYKILRYSFNLEPREYSFFEQEQSLIDIFTDPAHSLFLQCPFMGRSLDLENPGKTGSSKGRRFVMAIGTSISLGDDEDLTVVNYKSYDKLVPKLLEYFPKISPALVEKAVMQFNFVAKGAGAPVPATSVEFL